MEGSTGLLQGHRWGPAELAQLKGPVQCSVLHLNNWFMSAVHYGAHPYE